MLRNSKRSTSTPRLHGGKRSATPSGGRKHKDVERPAWDDTNGDLSKYKATPEQIARRKSQRVSKNMVNVSNLFPEGMSPDLYSEGADISITAPSPPAGSGTHAISTPEPATSPVIDYGAVLRLLQAPGTPPTTSTPPKQEGTDHNTQQPHAGADDIRQADQAQPAHDWAALARTALATSESTLPTADMLGSSDEMLDATMGAFSRLDMTATPPTNTSMTSRPQDGVRPGTAQAPPAISGSQASNALVQPRQEPVLSSFNGDIQGGISLGRHPGVHTWLQSQAATANSAGSADSAAVAVVQARQQQLGSQVSRLEAALQQLTDRQRQPQQLSPNDPVCLELQSLKQSTSRLQGEQAQLRAELTEFTQHAGTMISRLQAQLHQLLRTSVGGMAGPPTPAVSQAGGWPLASAPLTNPPYPAAQSQIASTMPSQPSRNLFIDLPQQQQPTWNIAPPRPQQYTASAQAQTQLLQQRRESPTSPTGRGRASAVPVANFDEQLALPSYAAMRKSSASGVMSFTPSGKAQGTAANNITTYPSGIANASAPASAPSRRTIPDEPQPQQRALPTHYQPRALGTSPIVTHGLFSSTSTSDRGSHLPTTRLGEAQVGSPADYGITSAGSAPFRGTNTMFGVLPEPMVFNMASDFKIVRVAGSVDGSGSGVGIGGGGAIPLSSALTPENSLSLAAHTAAAMRSKAARGH